MSIIKAIYGKEKKKSGIAPAVALLSPKDARNVGMVVRAASCFGIKQVWYSGDRFRLEEGERLPREERMRGYAEVELRQFDYFFDEFEKDVVPVAIELQPGAELLPQFEHPEKALYVFGPEDGSLGQIARKHCHRFVVIPTAHCTNLAAAVYIVLYDRLVKRQLAGLEPIRPLKDILKEERSWLDYNEV